MSGQIRVLVVDDSALMRKLIPQILAEDPSIEVVGTAMDGTFGLRKIEELRPHVVTLDLEMPRMDGIEMLRAITRKHHVPVIIFSAHTERGASSTLKVPNSPTFKGLLKYSPPPKGSILLNRRASLRRPPTRHGPLSRVDNPYQVLREWR